MGKTNLFWTIISKNYTAVSAAETPYSKLTKYTCKYCFHTYAYNVTRMAGHLLTDCKKCPHEVKGEINEAHRSPNIYQPRSSTSRSPNQVVDEPITTRKINARWMEEPIPTRRVNAKWVHVSKHYKKVAQHLSNGKKDKYICNYCSQRYACNVTRMAQHIFDCEMCPETVKNLFYEISSGTSEADSFALQPCGVDLINDSNSLFLKTNLFEEAPVETSNNFTVHKIEIEECNNEESDNIVEDISCSETNTTSKEEHEIWALFARACYATGTSVNIFHNEHWQKVFKQISPEVKLPPPQLLSQNYLNDEFTSINNKVEEKIKQVKTLGLQIIGLCDNKYESAITIVFTTPEPVVYKVLDAKTVHRNPNYLTDIISNIMTENGVTRILSIVTDNEQITWNALESKVPDSPVSCYTCTIHVLNVLTCEILNLSLFRNVLSKCTTIVKDIKNCENLAPLFFETGDKDTNLVIPSKKIGDKTKKCLNSLIKNKALLLSFAETTDYLQDSKNNILDENEFWPNVLLLRDLLKYLTDWIKQMKAEFPCISLVVESYFDLNNKFKETFTNLNVSQEQSSAIQNCLTNYQKLAIHDIHKAASLLNPYYMGKNLSDDDIIDAIAFINKLAKILPEVKSEKIMFDIAAYRTKQGIWAKDFVWYSLTSNGDQLPPVIWWQSMCASTEISKIAEAVLSCSPTLVNIGKLSDCIGQKRCKSEKAQKLLYIRHNLKLLETKEQPYNINGNEMEIEDCYYSAASDSDSSVDMENCKE